MLHVQLDTQLGAFGVPRSHEGIAELLGHTLARLRASRDQAWEPPGQTSEPRRLSIWVCHRVRF